MVTTTAVERLPPQNVEAEQALLGSLLIDRDAIIKVAPTLTPADFYRASHGFIFQAIMDLYNRRVPADYLTVGDELGRRGQLDEIGGLSYLFSLLNTVPTAVHAEYYAEVVADRATRRRLISAGTEVVALGFDEGQALEQVLDRAEQAVFDVAQTMETRDYEPISTVLERYFERIDFIHQHKGDLLGVPTGFRDLDKLTGGLQKSDLIILAARPSIGKTSLALGLAYNAAVRFGQRVGVYSLEMSAEQLVQRLLAMETGVDSHRLRQGFIDDNEWDLVSRAFGRLAEAKIYLDDTAGLSINELRSRARRLAAEQGIDLLLLDYLQLMQGRRTDNRVQEISEISRGLKALARELHIPIVALSQLSRAVESRQEHIPKLSDLRESGCLTGETLIYLPEEGRHRRLDELVGQRGFRVLALNTETWQLESRPVLNAFATGHKPVFRLTTRLGRSLRATANHRFLTVHGWRRLDELTPGARLALPRRLPGPTQATMGDDELALLGHLIGDGCTLPRHAIQYTTNDLTLAETIVERERSKQPVIDQVYVARSVGADPCVRPGPLSQRVMVTLAGRTHGSAPTTGAQHLSPSGARAVIDSAELAQLAESDVYWDEIIAIESDGEADVYDLTVEGLPNFVANGIVVHNSIEQDADIVMFIYREEIYQPETDKKGIAEIIVAKHRNGPIGTVPLRFFGSTAKFTDLELYRQPE